jgi:hypothetical protein
MLGFAVKITFKYGCESLLAKKRQQREKECKWAQRLHCTKVPWWGVDLRGPSRACYYASLGAAFYVNSLHCAAY